MVHQLRPHPPLLHVYLDALFDLDPQLGYEYHDEQVPLYAQYDPHRLLDFLAASNDYDLERVGYEAWWGEYLGPSSLILIISLSLSSSIGLERVRKVRSRPRASVYSWPNG